MPKLVCPCGYVHDLSSIPDEGWLTIRDVDYEKVVDAEILRGSFSVVPADDHPRVQEYDQATRVITESTGRLYECPECGRVMWNKGKEDLYTVYVRESKKVE